MTNEKREGVFDKRPSNAPESNSGEEGSIFERVVPEGIKRGFENLVRDGRLKHMLGDLKLHKEIVAHIMSQVDETKQATLGVISREVRLFLERTNLSDELAKLLTQISFEVKTQVRFVPSDKALKKEVKTTIESSPSPEKDSRKQQTGSRVAPEKMQSAAPPPATNNNAEESND